MKRSGLVVLAMLIPLLAGGCLSCDEPSGSRNPDTLEPWMRGSNQDHDPPPPLVVTRRLRPRNGGGILIDLARARERKQQLIPGTFVAGNGANASHLVVTLAKANGTSKVITVPVNKDADLQRLSQTTNVITLEAPWDVPGPYAKILIQPRLRFDFDDHHQPHSHDIRAEELLLEMQ